MTSIRASIASRATELRPTASSEKSRERTQFPSCLFRACWIVSHCACCQDFPPPPSLPRLDSPSLRPSLAAAQLRELLQAGSFAVRSDVRPQLSVRALLHVGVKQPNKKSDLSSDRRQYNLKQMSWTKYIHYSI